MIPNAKEISRACNGYTAVVRPNKEKGGWNAAVVDVKSGEPIFKVTHCETKEEIGAALRSDLRMMDKCGFRCEMAFASRHRNFCIPSKG